MAKVKFKYKARTINLLGKDNVLDYNSAIIEIIKNSFDAGSDYAYLYINSDTIEIIDSGKGMNIKEIQDNFFTVGTDTKIKNHTYKNRIMNGSMGIGRLSLGRLGTQCEITTSDGHTINKFIIDWNLFEDDLFTEELDFELNSVDEESFKREYLGRGLDYKFSGTIIKIKNLAEKWNIEKADKLIDSLRMLKNFTNNEMNKFNIKYKYFEKDIINVESESEKFLNDAVLKFNYDSKESKLFINGVFYEMRRSNMHPDFLNSKYEKLKKYISDGDYITFNKVIDRNTIDNITNGNCNLIGDFSGEINFHKISSSSKYGFISAIPNPLFKPGIFLYRDGFRVRPYGEIDTIGFDWIGIDSKRNRNPAGVARKDYLMQSKQISGYVNITKMGNSKFEDLSNRQGLKSSEEFNDLKVILFEIIKEFSSVRSNVIILYNEYTSEKLDINVREKSAVSTKKLIDKLIKRYNGDSSKITSDHEFRRLMSSDTILNLYSLATINEETNLGLLNENDMLRNLSTQGILMGTFAHQILNDKAFFSNSEKFLTKLADYYNSHSDLNIQCLGDRLNLYKYASTLGKKHASILGFLTSSLKNPSKTRNKRTNIVEYLKETITWWTDNLSPQNCNETFYVNNQEFKEFFNLEEILMVNASNQHLDSLFLNLLSNSYKNFKINSQLERKIYIDYYMSNDNDIIICYRDNGSGLNGNIENKMSIFNAYESYTGNEKDLGMGMWIFLKTLESIDGKLISVSDIGEEGFKLQFKLKGENV